jgi:predicted ATPase
VFWIGLALIRDPKVVLPSIADAIGAAGELAAHLETRETLLLLDNFEQVVDAAPGLPPLLESCPSLRLLVTSRELLRVRGEVEYRVPPRGQRGRGALLRPIRSGAPDAAVAELCRRLDDLPFAVELAARRADALSPTQILDRLGARLDLLRGRRGGAPINARGVLS